MNALRVLLDWGCANDPACFDSFQSVYIRYHKPGLGIHNMTPNPNANAIHASRIIQ